MADPVTGAVALVLAMYPAAALAGMLWHRASEGRRLAASRRDWARMAERRGLTGGEQAIPGGAWQLSYGGTIRGRAVTLAAQTSNPTAGWTHVLAHLHPPLDLGLHARPAGGGLAIPGTESPLDRLQGQLSIAADEPERARALFDLDLMTRLRHLARPMRSKTGPDVVLGTEWALTDSGFLHRTGTFVTDPRSIEPVLEAVLDVCDAVDRARARIGPAGPLREDATTWSRFAAREGLQVMTAPLAMAGVVDGIGISASARRTDRLTYGLGVEARFACPLGGALGLVPTAAGAAAAWLGVTRRDLAGDDWLLDDPAFDPVFRVRARDPGRLARLLPPELRARLLAVHERTPLLLDDLGIRVASERLPAAAEIPALLRDLAALAGEIEVRIRADGGTPYR